MKITTLTLFILVMFVSPAIAAFDVPAAAKMYLDDSVMMNLRAEPADQNNIYISAYCEEAGKTVANQFGSNQPVLFEIGIQNQNAQTYAAACQTIMKINKQAGPDELRAYSFILGTLLTKDAINAENIPANNMLYVVQFHVNGKNDFGFYSTVRSFIQLSELHPNGLPKLATRFFKAIFLGRAGTAMEILKDTAPTNEVKQMVKNISESS